MLSLEKYKLRLNDPCGRIRCGPSWRRTRENSLNLRDAEFWLVWKGRGTMRSGEKTHVLLPGFCALMRPGGIYDAEHEEDAPLGITYVHFDLVAPSGSTRLVTADVCQTWPEFFNPEDLAFFDAISRRIVQHFPQAPETAAALLRGLLTDLLRGQPIEDDLQPNEAAPEHSRRILQLVAEVHAGSTAPIISVADMAARLHMSPSHFSRLFKQTTGQSPMHFLLQVRLSHARHLLRETDLSVGEIADRLGYRDLFFFSRQFMQKEGVSPSRYRGRKG